MFSALRSRSLLSIPTDNTRSRRPIGPGQASYVLSGALAVAALAAGLATFVRQDWIAGPPAAVGCARGTALVVALVATPVMVVAMRMALRGSLRAVVVWLGSAVYLLYNAFVLLFATPYNRLFLLYVVTFSLAAWSIGAVLVQTDVARLARQVSGTFPARGIALYVWAVVALNALIWLKGILPTITADDPGAFLVPSGVTSQPIYFQDLAVWLPLMGVSALWLWRGRAWGYLLMSSLLVFGVLEAFGVAVDQWFGAQADPMTVLASSAMTPPFLLWSAIGTIPVVFALRALQRDTGEATSAAELSS